jgi:O-antigen ligase
LPCAGAAARADEAVVPESRRLPPGAPLAAIAAVGLVLAVLWPPEIDPRGLIAAGLVAALMLVLLAARPRGSCAPPPWTLLLLPPAAGALLLAACRSRALDEAAAAATLVVVGVLGRRLSAAPPWRRALLALVVVLATGAAARAAIQVHVSYPREAAALRAAGTEDTAGMEGRLLRGRPAGPFSLPAALGGFLSLSLPAALGASIGARGARTRLAAALAALLQIYALLLCRSLGALLAAGAGVVLALPILAPRRLRLAVPCALLLVAGAAAVVARSRPEIGGSPAADPLSLRAGNWGAAGRMILDHPLAGVGPGSFGTAYTRYRREGMNETRYAHNSYLQAAAGWGIWAAWPLAALAAAVARALLRAARERDAERLLCLAAGAGFLLHNLVDFTAFLPGVALPAALVIGLGLSARAGPDRPGPGGPRTPRARAALLAAALLAAALAAHAVAAGRSALLLRAAQDAARDGQVDRAADLARAAAAVRPADPDPHAFLAQLVLNERMHDPRLRAEGRAAADRALRLDREAAILHYTRGLYHQAAGEIADAYRERHAARRLYPLKPLYAPQADTP